MASDGVVNIPVTSLVHGSQAPSPATIQDVSGNVLPPSGHTSAVQSARSSPPAAKSAPEGAPTPAPAPTVKVPAAGVTDAQSLVTQLNKFLNDSGRPDLYRVDPASNNQLIQQINPATGVVIGEFPVSEFPALARSVGIPGVLINSHA
jgi:hypothetical protein